jgi:holo-ACP synthase
MITLNELLASRDARHATQQKLLAEHSGKTLVCLTVVMPGSVKRNQQSLTAAHAAVEAMRKAFGIKENKGLSTLETLETPENLVPLENPEPLAPTLLELDLETGYEAYLITPMPLLEAKRIAVNIEDTHPLGRLFDIDIINADGVPVSRDAIGEKPRRCLVCDHEARYCMRMRWHTQEEIWAKIYEMVDSYVEARKS